MKRPFFFQWLIIVGVVLSLLYASGASGSNERPSQRITNAALLGKATSAAVDSLMQEMPWPLKTAVYLRPAFAHEAAWMIENELGGRLRESGVKVIVSQPITAPVMADSSKSDTTTAGTSLQVGAEELKNKPKVMTLEYRITELGMEYPRVWRSHYIGRKMVERVAFVALQGRLIEETSGTLVWVGEGGATQRDVVPVSQLPFLEGKSESWQKGSLPAGKLGGLVEPLVVAAIVAGLVYLFYSNKE